MGNKNITTNLLTALKTHLENHPINLDTDSIINFLYGLYVPYVPVSTDLTLEKYRAVAIQILKLIKKVSVK